MQATARTDVELESVYVCVNESYGVCSFHACEKSVPELKMTIKVIRKD